MHLSLDQVQSVDSQATSPSVEEVIPKKAYFVRKLLTPEECEYLISTCEAGTFSPDGAQRRIRWCDRLQVPKCDLLSAQVWRRVQPILSNLGLDYFDVSKSSARYNGKWSAVGMNEEWRFIRYSEGGHFAPHCDASFIRSFNERSFLTFNMYLNDVSESNEGGTRFVESQELIFDHSEERFVHKSSGNEEPRIQPEQGSVLIFIQPPIEELLHVGEKLLGGVKYLARSDVMFVRGTPPELTETQLRAVEILQEAESAEAGGNPDAWKLYSQAQKLWPEVMES